MVKKIPEIDSREENPPLCMLEFKVKPARKLCAHLQKPVHKSRCVYNCRAVTWKAEWATDSNQHSSHTTKHKTTNPILCCSGTHSPRPWTPSLASRRDRLPPGSSPRNLPSLGRASPALPTPRTWPPPRSCDECHPQQLYRQATLIHRIPEIH